MIRAWKEYQKRVAAYFEMLGLDAKTDITVVGTRTQHTIDVLVRWTFLGQPMMWIVECKDWKRRVPKEKVFALRQIVDDIGADRGLLLNEAGYQKGALEAAQNANVHLTSIADLHETGRHDLAIAHLRQIYIQARTARIRYWAIQKRDRIELGLRGDGDPTAYSGIRVIQAVELCTTEGLLLGFPVAYDEILAPLAQMTDGVASCVEGDRIFDNAEDLATYLAAKITDLEQRLDEVERVLRERAADH